MSIRVMAAFVPMCGLLISAAPVSQVSPIRVNNSRIQGDYIEARTASVFAGACHYNGELMSIGRDAVMAWNFTSGNWHGTSLAGVKAVAAVTSDANLSDDTAAHRSELVIDSSATDAQAAAATQVIEAQNVQSLGKIVAVRRAPISFQHIGSEYVVSAEGFANIKADAMPNDECCKMPSMVWYSPLSPVIGRKVGYTTSAAYTAGTLGDTWERSDENSAIYGPFAY
jgi:hypothetical protein